MIHLFPGPVSSCLTPSSLLFKLCCWWRLLDRSLIEIFLSYAGQMAQWVKGQAGDLSSISGTHMVEEENQLPQEGLHAPTQSINQQIKKKSVVCYHFIPWLFSHLPYSFYSLLLLACLWPAYFLLPNCLVIPFPILCWFPPLCNHFKIYHNSYSGRIPHFCFSYHQHPLESQYSKNIFQGV